MTANPFAALLRDVPRYDQWGCRLSGVEVVSDDDTMLVMSDVLAALAAMTKERDEWKDAATRHHPNPAYHRYWEGRYRDEAAALATERAKTAKLVEALEAAEAWIVDGGYLDDKDPYIAESAASVYGQTSAAITEAGQ